MTEEELIQLVAGFPGVVVLTASEANGAPEISWGDSFFCYDPDGDVPADRRFPFATIVTKDYDGFDTASNLHRPGVFRLNVNVGRQVFQDVLGYLPAEHAKHHASIDYTAVDTVLPHPVYSKQGWLAILNPATETESRARSLLAEAHTRAVERHQAHSRR